MQKDEKGNRLQLTTILLMVIGIVVTVYFSVREQQSKGITLHQVTSRSLLTTEVGVNLTILFNEYSVKLPWIYSVRLANSGSLPIEGSDVEKPLTMAFSNSRIVHAEITKREPHDLEASAIHDSVTLTLDHGLLNPGDSFEADVLFDGQPPQPALSYRVTGLNTKLRITEFNSDADVAFIPWLPAPVRSLVVVIVSLCVVAIFAVTLYQIGDVIAPLLIVRNHLSRGPLNRLLYDLSSGEIPKSLRENIASQVGEVLPSEINWRVQSIIEDLPSDDLRKDPNALADMIMLRLPDEERVRLQPTKEILVKSLGLKEALAYEMWLELSSPLDDLVSCRRDSLTKSLDFGEDGIGRRRPDEGAGLGVPFGGVPFDPLDQLRYVPKRAAPNRLAGDDTEPDLHLVEPRSIRGCVVNVKPGTPGQPSLDLGMLMGGVVVDDEMDIEVLGHVGFDVA